ncbi:MotA/TolQ/ExbB proton channel family protein [candidate division KSB1 bacterium]|nr:MotA/TolQ/ExbB proton channel family protein [candidate division KSB1 bacterium]
MRFWPFRNQAIRFWICIWVGFNFLSIVGAQTLGDSLSTSAPTTPMSQSDSTKQGGSVTNQPAVTMGLDQKTLNLVYEYGGDIGKLTLVDLAIGIALLIRQFLKVKGDARDSRWVLDRIEEASKDRTHIMKNLELLVSKLKGEHSRWIITESKKLSTLLQPMMDSIKNMLQKISQVFKKSTPDGTPVLEKAGAKTTVFELFSKLYEVFKATRSTDGFNSELDSYLGYLKDKFNPFMTRLGYLSDTAGALGLLGTVWGMFLTFMSGNMEQTEVIQGMGIALATTIIGLVVSLILNTMTTLVSNMFDHHLEVISKMANDFQVRLMNLELAPVAAPVPVQPVTVVVPQEIRVPVTAPKPVEAPVPVSVPPPPKVHERVPQLIEILSKQRQQGRVNGELPVPLEVMVKDQQNVGIDGVTVTFEVASDDGSLNGNLKVDYVQTEGGGIARTRWRLGQTSGEKVVRVKADGLEAKPIRFFATAVPDDPSALIEMSGNYQVGRSNEELSAPLSVRVEDKYHNPIAGVGIVFKVEEGDAHFRNSRGNEYSAETNDKGVLEAYLTLGARRGGVRVVCRAKKVATECTFQAFAQ